MTRLLFFIPLALFAADPPKVEPAKPVPVISDALRADFWHAVNEANIAQANLRLIQEKLDASCKDTHYPFRNGKELTCVPKPVAPPQ